MKKLNDLKFVNVKIFFALKANYNSYIVKLLNKNNVCFEVVSIGELKYLIDLNINSSNIIFSGVCKSKSDIRFSLLNKVGYINVDSFSELKRIKNIDSLGKIKLLLRLNLDIVSKTNYRILTGCLLNKFGIDIDKYKFSLVKYIKSNFICIYGIGFHLGSQICDLLSYKSAILKLRYYYDFFRLHNINISVINIGGGFGVCYSNESVINFFDLFKYLNKVFKNKQIFIEPGRYLVANACITLSKIEYLKKNSVKSFLIMDIGMESIIRPILYGSYHKIKNVFLRKKFDIYDIVGPICESTDVFATNFKIAAKQNDYLIIYNTGAYCLSMRMIYNMRLKPVELLLKDNKLLII